MKEITNKQVPEEQLNSCSTTTSTSGSNAEAANALISTFQSLIQL